MDERLARELVDILRQKGLSEHQEHFERAFELTKAYASSANAQASAIPSLFEKLFELFAGGKIGG